MLRSVIPELQNLISTPTQSVLKKTLLCYDKIISCFPELTSQFLPQIKIVTENLLKSTTLANNSHGVLASIVQLFETMIKNSDSLCDSFLFKQLPKLIKIFVNLNLSPTSDPDFIVIDIEDPFLQICLLRFFKTFYEHLSINNYELKGDVEVIYNNTFEKILKFQKEEIKQGSTLTTPAISVLMEIIKLVLTYANEIKFGNTSRKKNNKDNETINTDNEDDILSLTFNVIFKLFFLPNSNIRFMIIQILSKFITTRKVTSPSLLLVLESILLKALEDRLSCVRHQSLSLIYHLTNSENAMSMVEDLINTFTSQNEIDSVECNERRNNSVTRAILFESVLKIISRFEELPVEWKIDNIITIMFLDNEKGDQLKKDSHMSNSASNYLMELIWRLSSNKNSQNKLINVVNTLRERVLRKSNRCAPDSLLTVTFWSIGEFCRLQNFDNQLVSDIYRSMLGPKNNYKRGERTSFCLTGLNTLMKLRSKIFNQDQPIKNEIENIFQSFSESEEEEIQKRACEYLSMSKSIPENKLQTIFESMLNLQNISSNNSIGSPISFDSSLKTVEIENEKKLGVNIIDLFSVGNNPLNGSVNSTNSNVERDSLSLFPLGGMSHINAIQSVGIGVDTIYF